MKFVTLRCAQCDEEYSIPTRRMSAVRKFCSRACQQQAQRRDTPATFIAVRIEPDQMSRLRGMAERDKTSVSEAVRTVIEWGFESVDCERIS